MGFGEILELKIKQISNDLALWLVEAFNVDKYFLRIGEFEIGVTFASVKSVLGLPRSLKTLDLPLQLLKRHPNVEYKKVIRALEEALSRANIKDIMLGKNINMGECGLN